MSWEAGVDVRRQVGSQEKWATSGPGDTQLGHCPAPELTSHWLWPSSVKGHNPEGQVRAVGSQEWVPGPWRGPGPARTFTRVSNRSQSWGIGGRATGRDTGQALVLVF